MPSRPRVTAVAVIRFDRTIAVTVAMRQAFRQAVLDSANEIQTRASQLAAVDTGSMRDSIYHTDGSGESDYTSRVSTARAENPDADILPEITPEFVIPLVGGGGASSNSPDNYDMVVGVGVGHGIFNELGTVNMRARPFLLPAAEVARDSFTERMSHITDNV